MNEFVQMDIFFFISSIAAIVVLLFMVIIGLYVFLIIKKVHIIVKEIKNLVCYASLQSQESIESIKIKIDSILSNASWVERVVVAGLGTILAKTIHKHGKIKKDVPKKK